MNLDQNCSFCFTQHWRAVYTEVESQTVN